MSRRFETQDATGIILNQPGIGILLAYGTTVPSDADAGYATGCIFVHTDGNSNTSLYTNVGNSTSADFNVSVGSPVLADNQTIIFGDGSDATIGWDGTQLEILPATDDTGALNIGDGTTDFDMKWFGGSTAKYVLFDMGGALLTLEDVDLHLGDNDAVEFGDAAGGDVRMVWNTAALTVLPKVDDTGSLIVGDGTTDMDVQVFLGTSTQYVLLDVGNVIVRLEDVDLLLGDNDELRFGDGAGGDVQVFWNATYLAADSIAKPMWTNVPSKLDPNYDAVAYELFDDFFSYDNTATTGNWVLQEVGTGTDAIGTATPGGSVVLTCQATTDNAAEQITKTGEGFKLAAGKTLWYEARIKLTGDATQSEISLGLAATENLTAVADVLPADGVSFSKQDGVTGLALTASKGGTDTGAVAGVHTIVSGTWVTLGMLISGITSVTPYVDGVAGTAATATIPDTEVLTPYFLVRNGDGTTQEVLEIDYVKVVQLR